MKNQYFGDINDYRKYGLLRIIQKVYGLRMLVAWMLTPDDRRSHGKFTEYLRNKKRMADYDKELFEKLCALMEEGKERRVELIEGTSLLCKTDYYSEYLKDNKQSRREWFSGLNEKAKQHDFIFLDPDNGLEIKTKPIGRKDSSKYLLWEEVDSLWESGKTLLIYQHFPREERTGFIQRIESKLSKHTVASKVQSYITSNVLFLFAVQKRHVEGIEEVNRRVSDSWNGQIIVYLINI